MTTKVKICGLKTPEVVDAAVEGGADMVGFVFFAPSPRNLETSVAGPLMERVPDSVLRVALTVDASDELLADITQNTKAGLLQLHGTESPERVRDIKARYGLPVMKMLPVSEASDLAAVSDYADVADKLLFDAKPPKTATRPGGNAVAFDWTILADFNSPLPWVLAGGLTSENVAEAIRISGAEAVDVSSAVEDAPGDKNVDKIRAFIDAVKAQ